jgi:hypothetical protein
MSLSRLDDSCKLQLQSDLLELIVDVEVPVTCSCENSEEDLRTERYAKRRNTVEVSRMLHAMTTKT